MSASNPPAKPSTKPRRPRRDSITDPTHRAQVHRDYREMGAAMTARTHGVSVQTVYRILDAVEADPAALARSQSLAPSRPPVREMMREVMEAAVAGIEKKIADPRTSAADVIKCLKAAASIGGHSVVDRLKYAAAAGDAAGRRDGPSITLPLILTQPRVATPEAMDPPPASLPHPYGGPSDPEDE